MALALPEHGMDSTSDRQLLADLQQLVMQAEAHDRARSSIITRVRLAHAKSMYVRAAAMIHLAVSEAGTAGEPVAAPAVKDPD